MAKPEDENVCSLYANSILQTKKDDDWANCHFIQLLQLPKMIGKKIAHWQSSFRLRLDPLLWECILEYAFPLKCILENAFFRMHFAENSVFGKILKRLLRSDYIEWNCVWLVF